MYAEVFLQNVHKLSFFYTFSNTFSKEYTLLRHWNMACHSINGCSKEALWVRPALIFHGLSHKTKYTDLEPSNLVFCNPPDSGGTEMCIRDSLYNTDCAGSSIKVLGKVDISVCLGLLEFSHQMLVANIVD